MDTSKPWSISASLRGFYDDNYMVVDSNERDSFGFEISPSVRFNLPLDQTYLGFRYIYSGRYYEDRTKSFMTPGPDGILGNADDRKADNDPWDHDHQFEFLLNHAFNERYTFGLQDSFVISREPSLLNPDGLGLWRQYGEVIRNQARATFNGQLTRLLGFDLGYNNALWDYDNDFYSASLDRMEHLALVNLRWQALPSTTLLVGYNFGAYQYTADEVIAVMGGQNVMSDDRNNQSHYIYAGVNHSFLRSFDASVKLGATYIDYDNQRVNENTWMPYADASLTYTYATGSYVRLGVAHSFNSTDMVDGTGSTTITSSQQSTSLYALLNHQFTAKLSGMVHANFQDSAFEGGRWNSSSEQYIGAGVNLTYMINRHFSCEAGYDFTNLDSDVPGRGYDRNRVYLGVTASY